jgi:hypothetical protein
MTDTTVTHPTRRSTREPRSRPRPRHRRRLDLRRLGRHSPKPITAELALHLLIQGGEVYEIGRRRFLVAALDPELIDTLIQASAIGEDDEDSNDAEDGDNDDFGIDDMPHDEPYQDMEPSLGGIHAEWSQGVNDCDREGDGDCDAEDDDPGGDSLDRGEFDPCDLGEPEEYLDG